MKFNNKLKISIGYVALLLLTLTSPSLSSAGGEQSGGGGIKKASFESIGEANSYFKKIKPQDIFNAAGFDKKIPNVSLPGSSGYYRANTALCIEDGELQTVFRSPRTCDYISAPIEEMQCQKWKVKYKERTGARTFTSERRAQDWANDSSNSKGQPYCDDEDWSLETLPYRVTYRVVFFGKVKGKERMSNSVQVGSYRYRFYNCSHFARQRKEADSKHFCGDEVQMAGGEQSGGGGKKKDKL